MTKLKQINIQRSVLAQNDELAEQTRAQLKSHGVLAVNLIAAPGAGKTSLIERTIQGLNHSVSVIEGDIAGSIDTQKVLAAGARDAIQINTAGACHLEAHMVQAALENLDLVATEFLFIENVGNLICPTSWDLGEALKICLVSAAEGDDKVIKYPEIFGRSDVILLNKIDLIPYVQFDKDFFLKHLRAINPSISVIELSCRTGEGVDKWLDFLRTTSSSFLKQYQASANFVKDAK